MKELNLLERYGSGSWAVVTGGSEGIGRGMAVQLAKRNFNIYLLSRDVNKLKETEKLILQQNNKIQVKILSVDFSRSHEKGFYENLMKNFDGLDVSILVNNVGVCQTKHFEDLPPEALQTILTVNVTTIAMMSKHFLNRLMNRKNRSAMINLSSVASIIAGPYSHVYCSTKIFDDYFSRGLYYRYNEKNIDSLSVLSGFVDTRMTKNIAKKPLEISEEECAIGTLKHLGRYRSCYPHWKHQLIAWVMKAQVFMSPNNTINDDMLAEAPKDDKKTNQI